MFPRRSRRFVRRTVAVEVVASLVLGLVVAAAFVGVSSRRASADSPPPPQPTSVTLTSSASSFVAGQSVTLTATTDVDVAPSGSTISIVDETTHSTVSSCTSGTTCLASGVFYSGGPHTYVATVNNLTSDPVTVSRAAWTVSLVESSDTFAAGGQVTLTATANQNINGTAGQYTIFIFDEATDQFVTRCDQSYEYSITNDGQTVCTVQTEFYTGGSHTYVAYVASTGTNNNVSGPGQASDIQATSNEVTTTRTPWTVSLSADKTTFAAGEQVTLTATANQNINGTAGQYTIFIFDETANTMLSQCDQSWQYSINNQGQTICTVVTQFYSGGPHTYVAIVASTSTNRNATGPNQADDVQATSNEVTGVTREAWAVALTEDTKTISAGQSVTLTATANQNINATNNQYTIFIFDETTNTMLSQCNQSYEYSINSEGQTVCTVVTQFYSGGPHTYVAIVASTSTNRNATGPNQAADVQATSDEVTTTRTPWTVSLSADKTTFAAGEQVTLTATANQNINSTNSQYTIFIFDETTGAILTRCNQSYEYSITNDGQTVCTLQTDFYSGDPHTYVAVVASTSTSNNATGPDQADDVQATSNEVTTTRTPWTVSLSADKTTFAAGEQVTLTATANQNINSTNNQYTIFIFDETTNTLLSQCNQSYEYSINNQGQTVCTVQAEFYTGDPHTYIAVVASTSTNRNATAPDQAADVQATSNEVTTTRTPWTVALSADKTTFAVGEQVTLTATANQNINGTQSQYTIFIFDETAHALLSQCNQSWQYSINNQGQTVCTAITQFYSGGPHTYIAVVASTSTSNNATGPDQADDVQATSNTVAAQRKAWTVALSWTVTRSAPDGEPMITTVLTATANQDVMDTAGSYNIYFVNYTGGAAYPGCNRFESLSSSGGSVCTFSFTEAGNAPTQAWFAAVSSFNGSEVTDLQATSNGLSAPEDVALQAGESRSGSNPSESSCQKCDGDPIDTATGEFTESATDIGLPGSGPGLMVARSYASSGAGQDGPLGYGWAFNYGARLAFSGGDSSDPMPRTVVVTQEDGSTVTFVETAGHAYIAPIRVMATLAYDSTTAAWTFVRKATQTLTFNSSGALTSLSDQTGHAVSLAYDGSGQLASASASGGRSLTFTWSGSHLVQVADSASRSVNYGYDSSGNLTSVEAVDGSVVNYGYDSAHQLTTVITPRGGTTTNVYDSSGRVVSQSDPDGRTTTFAYAGDPAGSGTTTMTAPDGSQTVENYVNGQLASQTKAAGTSEAATWTYGYDNAGNETTVTDPAGATLSYTYDSNGNQLTATNPLGDTTTTSYDTLNDPTSVTDPDGNTTTMTYTATGQRSSLTLPGGQTSHYTYDANGDLVTVTDPTGATVHDTYTGAGLLASTTDADGRTTSYGYDSAGRVTTVTGNTGHSTTTSYDAAGRTLSVTDADGHTTSYGYDADGNRTSVTDPDGDTTTDAYDLAGQLISTTDPTGATTSYTYTGRGLLASSTDPDGHTTRDSYDPLGDRTTVTDPDGNTTQYTYDSDSRLLSTTTAIGSVTSTGYNSAGQATSSTDANGHTTQYSFDGDADLTTTTDPDGQTTTRTYNSDGYLTAVTTTSASTTSSSAPSTTSTVSYGYDADGRLIATTDADGHVTATRYDPAGLVTAQIAPGSLTTTVTYDAAGHAAVVTQPDGDTETASYDPAGHVTALAYAAADGTTTQHAVTYSYDNDGNLTSTVDGTGTTTRSYDTDQRLTSVTDGAGNTVAYTYDPAGLRTGLTYPGGEQITYSYDADGLMTAARDWSGDTTHFSYDAASELTGQVDPNGVTTTTSYTAAGQTSDIHLTSTGEGGDTQTGNGQGSSGTGGGSATLADYAYTYDPAGHQASDTSTVTGSTDVAASTTSHTDTFDPLDQLSSVTTTSPGASSGSSSGSSGGSTTYTTTPGGLLTTLDDGSSQTFNAAEQLTSTTPPAAAADQTATSYTYDADGQRTTSTIGAGTANAATTGAYTYDTAGDLTSATTAHDDTVTYTTSAAGLRATRTEGSATQHFTWDTEPATPLLLDDGTHRYLYGPDATPYAQIDNTTGTIDYLHADLIGSVRLITDSTGTATGSTTYTAYGTVQTSSGTTSSAIGYTGNWTDPATGLVYLRARDYDPATGQFLAPDPDEPTTDQPYTYADNNPLLNTDPTGLSCVTGLGWLCHAASAANNGLYHALTHGFGAHTVSFIEGGANAITFGLVNRVDDTISPGSSCTYKKDGFYLGGTLVGITLVTIATDGAGDTAEAADAGQLADTTDVVDTSDSAGETDENFDGATCGGGSFSAKTLVKMADGSTRSLDRVKVGDKVKATNTQTGKTSSQIVSTLWVNHDTDLINVTIVSSGKSAVIHATQKHLFWIPAESAWVEADDLVAGQVLRTDNGATARVAGTVTVPGAANMWDLTVDNDHDFYVVTGSTTVLVHNNCGDPPPDLSPDGAGRSGAFNQAKRDAGIPRGQQPSRVGPNINNQGVTVPGRTYYYDTPDGEVAIREDAGGHFYGPNDPQNRGPHFNTPDGGHYDYP